MKQAPTWGQLLSALNDARVRPEEKGWHVYRYLSARLGDPLPSDQARTLLLLYMRLPLPRPSLLHSLMLGVALRMAETYDDFRLSAFLKMWDVRCLRPEDEQRQSQNGRLCFSLAERLAQCLMHYRLRHPDEALDAQTAAFLNRQERLIGYVDGYDPQHRFLHIFAPDSRHFVAKSPEILPPVGSYVWFHPIVPPQSKFKTAIVLRRENAIAGRQSFGITPARVTYINKEKGYFSYQIDAERKGHAKTQLSPRPLSVGDEVRLIVYLRRGVDGEKRLHVAEML